jgi:hypothetical protein
MKKCYDLRKEDIYALIMGVLKEIFWEVTPVVKTFPQPVKIAANIDWNPKIEEPEEEQIKETRELTGESKN